jgi:hypothetical protein
MAMVLHNLRLRFAPPRLQDEEFGELVFMYIPSAPERSYWEAQWQFPPTGTTVEIDLLGPEAGPVPETRSFYRALPARFELLLKAATPELDRVFRHWYDRPIAGDLWSDVKLAGFGLEDPRARPVSWQMYFEATGKKWLGIVIPFEDDSPGTAVVDT